VAFQVEIKVRLREAGDSGRDIDHPGKVSERLELYRQGMSRRLCSADLVADARH
jgi:hypothetical protein